MFLKFVLIPLGVISLAGIIYLAISKKSAFKLRIAALGALAVMVLAAIICLLFIFGGNPASKTVNLDYIVTEEAPPESGPNILAMIIFIVLILGMFLFVFITAMREHRKKEEKPAIGEDW